MRYRGRVAGSTRETRKEISTSGETAMPGERPAPPSPPSPSLWEAFLYWLKLGFVSFGGPAGQISMMHTELVERRRWISEHRFLHALNYTMVLPGPEAQQLATYIGWLMHGTLGGIMAGVLFVLPSLWEGLPMIILESMAAGCPTVATSVGGVPTALQDGHTGRLAPPRDPHALAGAINDLLGDEARRRTLGEAARRTFDERFTADIMARRYEALYLRQPLPAAH